MSINRRVQELEKKDKSRDAFIIVAKETGESDEEAMERYLSNGGEKPQGYGPAIIFLDHLDFMA